MALATVKSQNVADYVLENHKIIVIVNKLVWGCNAK